MKSYSLHLLESGFFHLAECVCDPSTSIGDLFLFIARQYFIVPKFVDLLVNEEHSGCFQFGVIMNNASVNIICSKQIFVWI